MKLERFIDDEKDRKIIDQVIKENFDIIKDVCFYLRSHSTGYPLMDHETLYNKVLSKLSLESPNFEHLPPREFKDLLTIMQEANESNRMKGLICRYQFLELIIKLAVMVYQPTLRKTSASNLELSPEGDSTLLSPTSSKKKGYTLVSQALRQLFSHSLGPFRDEHIPNI